MTIDYGKDVAQKPDHLNEELFVEVAENALRETNFTFEKIAVTMGSATGENYCSQIYRVKLLYKLRDTNERKELSVIIKSIPYNKASEFLQHLKMFLKERLAYSDLLPRLEILLDGRQKFAARLYHSIKNPVNTLVFEDLGSRGFEMASRESGLDETHCRLVLQKLANLHAVSMAFAKKDPESIEWYNMGMLHKDGIDGSDMLLQFFGGNAEALINLVDQWPGYEEITKKLRKYLSNLRDNLCRCQEPIPGELKVFNHGDLWVNNILFKYDHHRKVQDVIFVDFQLSIWGSPGIDLNYFFYTSLQLDILKNKRDQLLHYYHNELCSTLNSLKYKDIPSYKQILQEVRQREPYGFFANYAIFPIVSLDKNDSTDSNLENLADEDFARKKIAKMFASKRLEETMRCTLKRFDSLGIWD